jgi:two-component system OmpR family sensor kinase
LPLRQLVGNLSLRTRLTVWVVGVSTLVKLSVAVVFYLYQSAAVNQFFSDHLERRSEAMLGRVKTLGAAVTADDLQQVATQETRGAMFTGFLISVFDANGEVVMTLREKNPHYPLTKEEIRRSAESTDAWFRRSPATEYQRIDPGTRMVRSVIRGYVADSGQRMVLVATTSDTYAQQMLELVARALLVVVPTGIVISGMMGWYIAGLAVKPLEQIRRTASLLSPESIDRQLRVGTTSPELNRLEQELESARARMAAAFAAQERFMSNVSHEIKTPIAVMLTEAQTLDLRGSPAEVSGYVRSACEELRRLGGMVDSFLLLTRVREGRSLTQSRLYPINELVMESVAHCSSMAAQYGVRLEPVLAGDDLGVCVRGEPTLLRTMLDNLVRNAIRFSPRGESVRICASAEEDRVVVRVRDFGTGIPDAVIKRIFDRFVQAPDEQRRGRGHGLGLEIAQGIAELHGGHIGVRNCEDDRITTNANGQPSQDHGPPRLRGCEFAIALPRAVDSKEFTDPPSRSMVIGPDSRPARTT